MPEITCIDRNGNSNIFDFTYDCEVDDDGNIWHFIVTSTNPECNETFIFSVKEVDANTCRVIMMNHHNHPCYIAKGIPETMIRESARILQRKIISSTTTANNEDEYRTVSANAVWLRLINSNEAIYDPQADQYEYNP